MNADQTRAFLLKLPHVAETLQWGDNLVFWVGDKTIGGKMFVLINLSTRTKPGLRDRPVIAYAAGAERYPNLLEIDGLTPAPYFARAWWVAALRWDVFRKPEWEEELQAAHTLTLSKLSVRPARCFALLQATEK